MPSSAARSAGILLYRRTGDGSTEVFIGHMGGPFWARKDDAAWSIPKGLVEGADDDFATARREFEEEIGAPAPDIDYRRLGEFRYSSGKTVTVFAGESDFGVDHNPSNPVTIEWPPGSGRSLTFPELDRVEWCPLADAERRLVKGQAPAIAALERALP